MDKKIKRALSDVYHAPEPIRKRAFLKKYRRRELGRRDLLLTQAGYIRWWVWVASVLLFGGVLWLASWRDSQTVWAAAALTPFLALLIVVENGKSRFYGMEELELSCRMSLRTVALARMMILGLFHFLLLGMLVPMIAVWGTIGLAQAGVYLLTPYLLTAALGMELTRRCRGRDGLLACGGAAALVSGLGLLPAFRRPVLYRREYLPLWGVALAVAVIATVVEINLNFNKTEELQWN